MKAIVFISMMCGIVGATIGIVDGNYSMAAFALANSFWAGSNLIKS